MRALLALVLALACTQMACRANDYCLNCAKGDAGKDGGGDDGGGGDDAMTGDGGPCIPTGPEVCDGKDNDCDGKIDEEFPEQGQPCQNQTGECAGAVKVCVNGAVRCSKEPAPEICDGKDNDCNGLIDEGDPLIDSNGTPFPKKCGTDVGECVAGANHCVAGQVQCIGAVGTVGGQPELCNGKDDDCNGVPDDNPTDVGGLCGVSNVGECKLGTVMCIGGGPSCVGDQGPSFEICDGKDNDCDGIVDNGFDLDTDPNNCGACNHVCMLDHAIAGCSMMHCAVASCEPDFFDVDHVAANGCEYGPCQIQGPVEACNGVDDNCNGQIDEGLTPPPICNQVGECAGTVAVCLGAAGWKCMYPSTVSVDSNGNIIPETTCDGLDNDCDGKVDEGQPNLGQACHDNGLGVCQKTGTFVCDSANPDGPATCHFTGGGGTASPEICDGIDNDCDGVIDNGAETGNLPGQAWVTIAGTTQIMKYEASRPDATATGVGTSQVFACSRSGVQPWTNVKYPQAVAACASIGARLCTEAEWQASCAPPITVTYPVAGPSGATDYVFIEAEQAQANTSVGGHTWTVDTSAPATGFSGTSALQALPNDGLNVNNSTSAVGQSPRLDFRINFQQTGNHFVWVRMLADPTGSQNGNAIWLGFTQNPPPFNNPFSTQLAPDLPGIWTWVASPALNISATGNWTVSIYMRRAGVRVDAIAISKDGTDTPPFDARQWAYATNPKLPQPQVCNDNEFDTGGGPGDQDDILPTGSLPACFANGPGTNDAFDMSGNVKEWCVARSAGHNPIRGGASNNDVGGTACGLNFTLADDAFFFPNVGFRCCR